MNNTGKKRSDAESLSDGFRQPGVTDDDSEQYAKSLKQFWNERWLRIEIIINTGVDMWHMIQSLDEGGFEFLNYGYIQHYPKNVYVYLM